MGYYIIESTDKKQIMNWADRIWDAGIIQDYINKNFRQLKFNFDK